MDMSGLALATGGQARRDALPAPRRERYPVIVIGGGQAGLSVGYHLAAGRSLRYPRRPPARRRRLAEALGLAPPVLLRRALTVSTACPSRRRQPTSRRRTRWATISKPMPGISTCRSGPASGSSGLHAKAADICWRPAVGNSRPSKSWSRWRTTRSRASRPSPASSTTISSSSTPPTTATRRSCAQGEVLIVGMGNSGAEIAFELARHGHRRLAFGQAERPDPLPRRWPSPRAMSFVPLLFRGVFHRLLTVSTPIGRKVRPKALHAAAPLIRVKAKHLAALGVERVAQDRRACGTAGRCSPTAE